MVTARLDKGKPCGEGFIAANKECRAGQGSIASPATDKKKSRSKLKNADRNLRVAFAGVVIGATLVGLATLDAVVSNELSKQQAERQRQDKRKFDEWFEQFQKNHEQARKQYQQAYEEARQRQQQSSQRSAETKTGKKWWEVLGVSANATKDDIKKAYRRAARKFHPDVNKDPKATEMMQELNNAFDLSGARRSDSNPSTRLRRVVLGIKRQIDTIYRGGVDAVLTFELEDNDAITGKFRDGGEVYDFTISPTNELSYVESKVRSDAYLLGWQYDSGNARGLRTDAPRRSIKKKVCAQGKPCGDGCIAKGLTCRVKLSPRAGAELKQIRNEIRSIKSPSKASTKATASSDVSKRFNVSPGVAVGAIAGAALIGMPIASYMAFRTKYRNGFEESAKKAERQASQVEEQLRKEAIARTGKADEDLTPDDIYKVDRYPGGSDKKRSFGVDPNKPNITFTIGGFNDYGEDGTGMAVSLKRALDEDSIIPLTNKKVQITPEDTWLPMNDLLDETEDPDGQGGTVKRGFLARRGVTDALKGVLGDRYPDFIDGLRNNETYKQVEPVARLLIRNSRDLNMLATNATGKGYHEDAIDVAAQMMAFHKAYPDKPLRIVAHSGGGYAASEAAEILNRRGIKIKVVNIATPYWGLTELPKDQMMTIISKNEYMSPAPSQNRFEIDDVNAHNWVGHAGTQGYGNSKQMQTALRTFFYGADKAERKRKKKEDSAYLEAFYSAIRTDNGGKPCGKGHISSKKKCRAGQTSVKQEQGDRIRKGVAVGAAVSGASAAGVVAIGAGLVAAYATAKNAAYKKDPIRMAKTDEGYTFPRKEGMEEQTQEAVRETGISDLYPFASGVNGIAFSSPTQADKVVKMPITPFGFDSAKQEWDNLVKAHEIGVAPKPDRFIDGKNIIVMENLMYPDRSGGAMRLANEDPDRVDPVQLAKSLTRLHAAGLTHGDLSYNNLMVNEKGRYTFLDLGNGKPYTAEAAMDDLNRLFFKNLNKWQSVAGSTPELKAVRNAVLSRAMGASPQTVYESYLKEVQKLHKDITPVERSQNRDSLVVA